MKKGKNRKIWYTVLLGMLLAAMLFSCPVSASAKTVKKTVSVKSGKDITKKLQTTLNLAKKNPKNTYKITVKPGTYKINGTLKIYSNTELIMTGVTFKRVKNNVVMLRFGGSDKYKKYSQAKNVKLTGGTWDGAGKTGDLVRLGHGQNITIKDVTFTNVKEAHHMEFAACKNITITGCTFKDYKGDTISNHVEALQIDIMRQEHFDYYPAYDETPSVNVTITKCTFKNLQGAVGTHSAVLGSYHENINISNNKFENITGYAIIGMNWLDSKINNNTIKNCGLGVVYRTLSATRDSIYKPKTTSTIKTQTNINLEIIGNKITVINTGYQERSSAIRLYGQTVEEDEKKVPAGNYRVAGIKVQKNTITQKCKGVPIVLSGVDSSTVKNNKITCNFVKNGASMGNDVGSAIRIEDGKKNTISGNTINNTVTAKYGGIWGIAVYEGAESNTISGNTINNAGKDGIILKDCANNVVKSNKINNSTRRGIYSEGCKKLTISSNTVKKSGNDGIYVSTSTNIVVKSNVVTDSVRYGLFSTNNATVAASGNSVSGSGERDIWAWNGGELTGQALTKKNS